MTLTAENDEKAGEHSLKKSAKRETRKPSHRCCIACATKCEELQQGVDLLTEKLKAAEEETKKLHGLLRLAVYQKLQASNRLKELNVNLDEVFLPPKNEV